MPADFDPSSGSSLAGSSLASSSAAPAAPSMIFDDRLETVLRTRAAGPAGLRVQFRQLVDLLGRVPEQGWNARHDEALARLDTLFEAIATPQEGARPAQAGPAASLSGAEAAAALLAATHLAHPRLVAHFAAQGPRVALASIRGARLDEASWLDLIPRLPIQARGFLRHRRDLGPAVERLLEQLGIDDFALTGPEALPQRTPSPNRPRSPCPPPNCPMKRQRRQKASPRTRCSNRPARFPPPSKGSAPSCGGSRPSGATAKNGRPRKLPGHGHNLWLCARAALVPGLCLWPVCRRCAAPARHRSGLRSARHDRGRRCRFRADAGGPPPVPRAAPARPVQRRRSGRCQSG
jgi:hypothetical protein